ncbi:potassium voltage-gated channel protein egl-36 [Patella vulgata]|uniref:potassium voltage-gated channel protein egl-36 n=1 Tax=Patella vulgata TaxID=6465 RepID=UPI0024A85559|nr:potassium voltage-gated channel protein egl-36 [Patella vulgata]
MAERFTVNVSGRKFEISRNLLEKYPESTLTKMCFATGENEEIFLERPLSAFEAILEFYQTGDLHIPESRCYSGFTEEIKFWGFCESDISTCCQRKLASFRSGQRDLNEYDKYEMTYTNYSIRGSSCCGFISGKWRSITWNLLDNCSYNIFAKVLYVISILVVLTSTITTVLLTHVIFDEHLSPEGWKLYFGDTYEDHKHIVDFIIQLHNGGTRNYSAFNITKEELDEFPTEFRVKNIPLTLTRYCCTAFFTVELILRLVFCPSLKLFFKFALNIIDVLAVIVAYVDICLNQISQKEEYSSNYFDFIQLLQVLRVLRLFRLTRNITGARVLVFAVKNSVKELFFMFILLSINAVLFATLVYCFDDNFGNLSYAIWWAFITMTTVGYGDVVPNSTGGRVVGVVCASTGIVLIALTIPLFVNNFLAIYTFAQSKELVEKDKMKIHPKDYRSTEKENG